MKHKGTKSLNTDRLLLRKFKEIDVFDAYKNWTNDEKVTKFLTWNKHKSVNETKILIDKWIELYNSNSNYQWAIILKNENINIGTISVVKLDEDNETAYIGYCIGYDWWNKGYTTEAFKEIIKFLFENCQFKKIIAKYHNENIYSGKVMFKSGLKYECNEGNYCVLSITNQQYHKINKK